MSWFTRMLRRGEHPDRRERACTHVNLTARWDNSEDVGNSAKASGYACIACGDMFKPEEVEALGGPPAV